MLYASYTQQYRATIGAQIDTLEEAVTECVQTGQVIHALLSEHQQPVEVPALHCSQNRSFAGSVFSLTKVDIQGFCSSFNQGQAFRGYCCGESRGYTRRVVDWGRGVDIGSNDLQTFELTQ